MTDYIIATDHTNYTHIAQPGDVCQICRVPFWPGEVVTAVCSGGDTVGLHCADIEACAERLRANLAEQTLASLLARINN